MNIYEITGEYKHLQEALESGEISDEEYNDMLECMDFELEAKADGYGAVIRNMEATINAISAEESLLSARRKALENRVDRLKANLLTALLNIKGEKVKGEIFGFSVRKSERVEMTDEREFFEVMDANPNEKAVYVTVNHKETPNKAEIKKALKKGVKIPGARIMTNKNLQLKVG